MRIVLTPRSLEVAGLLRKDVMASRCRSSATYALLRSRALSLEEGYRFYIKYDNGKNLQRAFDSELNAVLGRIGLSIDYALGILTAVAQFCFEQEDEFGADKYPLRLQGANLEMKELNNLAQRSGLGFNDDGVPVRGIENFHVHLDAYIRFRAAQISLREIKETVMFGAAPLVAVGGKDEVALMFDLIGAGIKIADFEGAVELWKDGTISPLVKNNVVQVSDLVKEVG